MTHQLQNPKHVLVLESAAGWPQEESPAHPMGEGKAVWKKLEGWQNECNKTLPWLKKIKKSKS